MPLYDVRWIGDDEYGTDGWEDATERAVQIEASTPRAAVDAWLKLHAHGTDWAVVGPDLLAVRPAHTSEWQFSVDLDGNVTEACGITQVEIAA